MKHLFLLFMVLAPTLASAQLLKHKDKPLKMHYRNPINEAGTQLRKAGTFLIGGFALEAAGGAMVAYGSSEDNQTEVATVGGLFMIGGVVLQIIAYTKFQRAGRLMENSRLKFTGSGLSYNF